MLIHTSIILRTIHRNEVQLCPHCDYRSRSGPTLMKFHLVTKHNDYSLGDALIYQCKYCEYKSCKRKQLGIHEKSHEIKSGMVLCYNRQVVGWGSMKT